MQQFKHPVFFHALQNLAHVRVEVHGEIISQQRKLRTYVIEELTFIKDVVVRLLNHSLNNCLRGYVPVSKLPVFTSSEVL